MIEEAITYKCVASFLFYNYSYYNIDRLERGPGHEGFYKKRHPRMPFHDFAYILRPSFAWHLE